jgi:hypothetical protein
VLQLHSQIALWAQSWSTELELLMMKARGEGTEVGLGATAFAAGAAWGPRASRPRLLQGLSGLGVPGRADRVCCRGSRGLASRGEPTTFAAAAASQDNVCMFGGDHAYGQAFSRGRVGVGPA